LQFTRKRESTKTQRLVSVSSNNLYNSSINKTLDLAALEQVSYHSKYINELFLNFYRPYYAIYERVKSSSAYKIEDNLDATQEMIVYAINNKLEFSSSGKKDDIKCLLLSIKYWLETFLNLFVSFLILILFAAFNALVSKRPNFSHILILERTPAASAKLSWHKKNLEATVIKEKVRLNNNFYAVLKVRDIFSLVSFMVVNVICDFKFIYQYSNKYFGSKLTPYIMNYFAKRIPHAVMYEFTLDKLLSIAPVEELYSGNNLDRFGLIEEKVCRKHAVKMINIPHGIEFGFLFPHCFAGDVFYALSNEGADYLNQAYKTNKFVFSEDVTKRMLQRDFKKDDSFYVFFTEPSEIEINRKIIEEIKKLSLVRDNKFYIKLHPRDTRENYIDLGIDFIADFNAAITNNICIARKSTVLLEAIYNNSKAIAVLLNESDKFGFNQFPSLQDPRIRKVYNLEQLNSKMEG